jgi:hypothetical protein
MRRYRSRGRLRSVTWAVDEVNLRGAHAEARARLDAADGA